MLIEMRACALVIAALGLLSSSAGWATEPASCGTEAIPGVATPYYDANGRLEQIEDHVHRTKALFLYDRGRLQTIIQTRFVSNLREPDRWGRTEFWAPTRNSEYGTATGRLIEIDTYEASKPKPGQQPGGYQSAMHLPADLDFEKLRDPKDGKLRFTGAVEKCTVMYDCKSGGTRTIEVTEPLFSSDECFAFAGTRFRMARLLDTAAAPSKVDSESGRKICIGSSCIVVHDEPESDAPSPAADESGKRDAE